MAKDNKIHVGFGFHVNCYHSYRGDSNDGLGFGSDIRIIRKIIDVLNDLNEQGIPVKGTWDSENFFSLEKILPEHAPDIIEGIKYRTDKWGDENIIMGYSNGALSAMNEEELTASIKLAVTNPEGSGIQDLFGKCEMIVRPQEVMFTPSDVSVYNKCGVKALCLYYSCVPFDAFRTIIPRLSDEHAFNPLTYSYKGEELTILPTYNNSDICDAGCLRSWVKELHAKQVSGQINRDMFIFVNMDADAIFWETMKLPVVGSKIANTDGIHGLVMEVADLDYVEFNTPGGYLADHEAVGKIDFTHDVADGNFTGYASWSEKPYNRKIWTAIERSRAMAKVNAKKDNNATSFKERVLLLSTTHFGLATPVLNIERERTANALADSIVKAESEALPQTETIRIHNITGSTLQCLQLKTNGIDDASKIRLKGRGLKDYTVIGLDDKCETVFAVMRFGQKIRHYDIEVFTDAKPQYEIVCNKLETATTQIIFNHLTGVESVTYKGKKVGGSDFLKGFITYNDKSYDFRVLGVKGIPCGGTGKVVRVNGSIHLPGEMTEGSFVYDFFTFGGSDNIYVRTTVNYPYTEERDSITTENSTLGRFTDNKWSEAVPFQLTPEFKGDLSVVKRNFMGDISSFRTASFIESDERNSSLASFNHQLTAGVVGLTGSDAGMLIGNSRQVLNSMAHCPMRLDKDGTVHLSPFGHFYGPQRHHWSRGKDEILNVYTLVTPQGKSIAPAYDGVTETAMMSLCFYDGGIPTEEEVADIIAFADGAVATAPEGALLQPFYGDNVTFRETKENGEDGKKLANPVWNGLKGHVGEYISKGYTAISHIVKAQIKSRK